MSQYSTASAAPFLRTSTTPTIGAFLIALLGLIALYCARLWPEWSQNPDLSHGFLAPLVFFLLVDESRRRGAQRWLQSNSLITFAVAGSAFAGLGLFALAGLLAASVAWTHALVLFLLGASLCSFLFCGLLILSDNRVCLLPFNWISFTALFLWLLVAPLPSGTYARLTLTLQTAVTGAVFHTLHVLGVPAQQHGNMIELARTTVGVEEACSGVRSLLSCIYAGFFFAAWLVRSPKKRLLLIVAAPVLALVMNFVRSLLLTLLANAGKDISGIWHNATGYAVLTVTSLLLAWLAFTLEGKRKSTGNTTPFLLPVPTGFAHASLWSFWAALSASLALGLFYLSHSALARNEAKPIPDIAAMLPVQADGWQVSSTPDLYQFSNVLQTTHLVQRTYLRAQEKGEPLRLTVYVAYWPAGQATVSRVASHTPDACWPGSGWAPQAAGERRQVLGLSFPRSQLYPAEHRVFQNQGISQHVWFWHLYDGSPINYRDPYSVPALLELAWQYGFRSQGDQAFIRFSSNRPWTEIASEPLVGEIVGNLTKLGL